MLDIQSGTWIEITFIEGYEPKCTLSNILYGIMYRDVWAEKGLLGCVIPFPGYKYELTQPRAHFFAHPSLYMMP